MSRRIVLYPDLGVLGAVSTLLMLAVLALTVVSTARVRLSCTRAAEDVSCDITEESWLRRATETTTVRSPTAAAVETSGTRRDRAYQVVLMRQKERTALGRPRDAADDLEKMAASLDRWVSEKRTSKFEVTYGSRGPTWISLGPGRWFLFFYWLYGARVELTIEARRCWCAVASGRCRRGRPG